MNEISKGIIVSIQGFSQETTRELAMEVISAGAVALRTDKPVRIPMDKKVPIIGLLKIKVSDPTREAYITPTIRAVEAVARWADYVAVDCRAINNDLQDVVNYCQANKIRLVADLADMADYENLARINAQAEYVTTALAVYRRRHYPDKKFVKRLVETKTTRVIAEGNYRLREDVEEVYAMGVHGVCIGAAITNVYKLARKFTTIEVRR